MNDFRQATFNAKFDSAAKALGVTPDKLVSLKLRETVTSYEEYHDLIRSLEREFGFECSPVEGELQGRGHFLSKGTSKVIIVEHESGLEILYIAGSIASLVSLIPLILQGWNAVRQFANPRNPFDKIEVRRLDERGVLQEHAALGLRRHGVGDLSNFTPITTALVEEEFQKASNQIESLLLRVAALEKSFERMDATLKRARLAKRAKRK